MSAKPRSDVFDPDTVGVYHCWNQLVRQRHLFGKDNLTGKDYSYRKHWVRDRFKQLAGVMAIDILDYGVLDSHLHIVLRNRPDIVESWSDEEVARRWWYVCPDRKNQDGSIPPPKPCEIKLNLLEVDEFRKRLSDISWMMRLATQRIARRANKEDEVRGRFFAQRFDCNRLESVADVLACSLYVDLNVVRAGLAESPETSEFTSAFDRIRARWQRIQREMNPVDAVPAEEEADAWLAPVFLDERAEAYGQTIGPRTETSSERAGQPQSNPVNAPRISNKGFLSLTLDQYLTLLDEFGRIIRSDKRGSIPQKLAPILERLNMPSGQWVEAISTFAKEFPRLQSCAEAFP